MLLDLIPAATVSPSNSLGSLYPLALGLPSGYEWIVIGLIVLLIFGKRLPGAARGIGEAFREFQRGINPGPTEVTKESAIAVREPGV